MVYCALNDVFEDSRFKNAIEARTLETFRRKKAFHGGSNIGRP
jgi:hypothetical protein